MRDMVAACLRPPKLDLDIELVEFVRSRRAGTPLATRGR
jgi:hypothetical protein